MNGSVTKSPVNKKYIPVTILEAFATSLIVVVKEEREYDNPNFRERQLLRLERYKCLHTSNQLVVLGFMKKVKTDFASSSVVKRNRSQRKWILPQHLIDN